MLANFWVQEIEKVLLIDFCLILLFNTINYLYFNMLIKIAKMCISCSKL